MEWYLKVLRQYADFQGRARRKEYWMFTLFHIIAIFVIAFMSGALAGIIGEWAMILYLIYILGTIIPTVAVTVRRLHDTGRSGWVFLLSLVPILSLWVFILTLMEGEKGENPWGPDPKMEYNYSDVIDEIGQDPLDEF